MSLPSSPTLGSVWAIVVNWYQMTLTFGCVRRLVDCHGVDAIVVVDNGSYPEEAASLSEHLAKYEKAILIRPEENLGYAGGMQYGIQHAINHGAAYVWLVNNDCYIEPDSLQPLLQEMAKHPSTAACSGIVEHPELVDGRFNGGGQIAPVRGKVIQLYSAERAALPRYEVDFVPGHAWLLRVAVISQVGGLDCRLFVLGEESDWCFRARKRGFRAVVIPGASLQAESSSALKEIPCEIRYYGIRNMAWLVRRQASRPHRLLHHILMLGYRVPKMSLGLLMRRQANCIRYLLSGARSGLFRSPAWSDNPDVAFRNRLPSLVGIPRETH
jgi:GT2 family glycosyltransferase